MIPSFIVIGSLLSSALYCHWLSIVISSLLLSLHCSIDTGCLAIQPLLNIKQVMEKRRCSEVWNNKDELPVCVTLDP